MWRAVALVSLLSVGCGGAVSKVDSSGGGSGAGTATGNNDGGSLTTAGAGGATAVPIGDPTSYPPAPPSSPGAFFWRYGLGNWFVSKSDNANQDATSEPDGQTIDWKAEGAAQQSLDLWAQLNHPAGIPIDLSVYSGVSFDAQLTGASAPLVLAFNAFGKYQAADVALDAQRFNVTPDWQSFELRFSEANYTPNATKSFDFIVTKSDSAFVLKVRNLALLCKASCP